MQVSFDRPLYSQVRGNLPQIPKKQPLEPSQAQLENESQQQSHKNNNSLSSRQVFNDFIPGSGCLVPRDEIGKPNDSTPAPKAWEAKKNEIESKPANAAEEEDANEAQCRLCWDTEFDSDNPLIQICQCRGGVEFIHYHCLQSWLKTKEYRQVTTHYTSLYWNQFQCEICKNSLPYVFIYGNRKYPLVDIPVVNQDHLILESITLENKHSRMVHILHPKKEYNHRLLDVKHFRIGRGQDCDVKVTDISVSRNHCKISYINGKFFLNDTKSKFGTLLLSRGPIEIHPCTTVGV